LKIKELIKKLLNPPKKDDSLQLAKDKLAKVLITYRDTDTSTAAVVEQSIRILDEYYNKKWYIAVGKTIEKTLARGIFVSKSGSW